MKPKSELTDLRMPADEFDRIMRGVVQVKPEPKPKKKASAKPKKKSR